MSEAVIRAKLRSELVGRGCPADFADQAIDIGIHAASKSYDMLVHVLQAAPTQGLQMTATGIAASILSAYVEGLRTALEEFAPTVGAQVDEVSMDCRQ